jgi:hypothetical protein
MAKRSHLSRPLRFFQFPQPQSIIDRRPIFTVTQSVREAIQWHNPASDVDYGWVKILVRDHDAHYQPQVGPFRAMWVGKCGSGEIHLIDLNDRELEFFQRGHQFSIEVLGVEGRIPNSREVPLVSA